MHPRYLTAAATTFLSSAAYAQVVGPEIGGESAFLTGPHFFMALVAGLVLAMAFQLLLTNLSAAVGITSVHVPVGSARKVWPRRPTMPGEPVQEKQGKQTSMGETLKKATTAVGIWTLITATIALFFASWLAVELSLTENALAGVVLGLVIWGVFYLLATVLEVSAATSLVGFLTRTATTGLRSLYTATASIFAKSPEDRSAEIAASVTDAVRDELMETMHKQDVRERLEKYIETIKPKRIDPAAVGQQIIKALDETEMRAVIKHGGEMVQQENIVAKLETSPHITKEEAHKAATGIKSAFEKAKQESKTQKETTAKVADTAMQIAGLSEQQAEETRHKIENYLRNTEQVELDPKGIERDISLLFHDPKAGTEALKARLSMMDKSTVAALLAERKDISQSQASQIADRIDRVVTKMQASLGGAEQKAHHEQGATKERIEETKRGIEAKIHNYLDSMGRPELSYEGIRHDLVLLLHNPREGLDAFIQRLKSMDRDTLKAVLASRKDISPEDADRMINRVERSRDDLILRAEELRDAGERHIANAEREALVDAEKGRKATAAAAWWAFGTAIISGGAAALGGLIAVLV